MNSISMTKLSKLCLVLASSILFTGCGTYSVLKVCKVAGPGISQGDAYQYDTSNGETAYVQAGPAPGGYCQKFDTKYGNNFEVTLTENSSSSTFIKELTVVPEDRELSRDMYEKSVSIRIGSGVTEATFVNTTDEHGYLEICKHGGGSEVFEFTFNNPEIPNVEVRGESCSPPMWVPAGNIVITELNNPTYSLVGCSAYPSNHQISCTPSLNQSEVLVEPGNISTQTIAYMKNDQ